MSVEPKCPPRRHKIRLSWISFKTNRFEWCSGPYGHQLNNLRPTLFAMLGIRPWGATHPSIRPELVEGPPTRKSRLSRYDHWPNTLFSTFLTMLGGLDKKKRLGLLRQNVVFSDQILRPSAPGRIRMTHHILRHSFGLSPSGPSQPSAPNTAVKATASRSDLSQECRNRQDAKTHGARHAKMTSGTVRSLRG